MHFFQRVRGDAKSSRRSRRRGALSATRFAVTPSPWQPRGPERASRALLRLSLEGEADGPARGGRPRIKPHLRVLPRGRGVVGERGAAAAGAGKLHGPTWAEAAQDGGGGGPTRWGWDWGPAGSGFCCLLCLRSTHCEGERCASLGAPLPPWGAGPQIPDAPSAEATCVLLPQRSIRGAQTHPHRHQNGLLAETAFPSCGNSEVLPVGVRVLGHILEGPALGPPDRTLGTSRLESGAGKRGDAGSCSWSFSSPPCPTRHPGLLQGLGCPCCARGGDSGAEGSHSWDWGKAGTGAGTGEETLPAGRHPSLRCV